MRTSSVTVDWIEQAHISRGASFVWMPYYVSFARQLQCGRAM
jgi:hypothetical protein